MTQPLWSVDIRIADLPGTQLGGAHVESGVIRIDVNGAGVGWFIDQTPLIDEELATDLGSSDLVATETGGATGQYDLMTLVMHEFGHILGLEDLDHESHEHELMTEVIDPGVRRSGDQTTEHIRCGLAQSWSRENNSWRI